MHDHLPDCDVPHPIDMFIHRQIFGNRWQGNRILLDTPWRRLKPLLLEPQQLCFTLRTEHVNYTEISIRRHLLPLSGCMRLSIKYNNRVVSKSSSLWFDSMTAVPVSMFRKASHPRSCQLQRREVGTTALAFSCYRTRSSCLRFRRCDRGTLPALSRRSLLFQFAFVCGFGAFKFICVMVNVRTV